MALLHLLHRHGFRDVVVCHLDHGLRGRASTTDGRFVGKLAASLGYPCESGKTDVRNDVPLGTGQVNFPAFFKAAETSAVKYHFIEDESPTVVDQIPQSLEYLKQFGGKQQ